MHLRHMKTLHAPSECPDHRFARVSALCASPNNYRLAVATQDRYITVYDEEGVQRDRFPTKAGIAADKGMTSTTKSNYLIRGLAFSPDSTRLAVAQSDNIVFVYKLGKTWADKKTICNKYPVPSSVTCVCWPSSRQNDLVFGCADGKVKIGNSSNKSLTLFNKESYVTCIAVSLDGYSLVTGHLDGSICKYSFAREEGQAASHSLLTNTPFTPLTLCYTQNHILAAGNSPVVCVYDHQGVQTQKFDYARLPAYKEFCCSSVHPAGQTVCVGNYSLFISLSYSQSSGRWEEGPTTHIDNLLSITAMQWKPDGSKLHIGSLSGAVDSYDACLKRYIYKTDWEITYTSNSSVLVRQISTGHKLAIQSKYQLDISHISIHRQRYIMAKTRETLILGDVQRKTQSEIQWNHQQNATNNTGKKDKYFWDNESSCMIYSHGELHVIEYGIDEIIGSCRTEYMSPHLISIRINEEQQYTDKTQTQTQTQTAGQSKKLAYLLDNSTINIMSLSSGSGYNNNRHSGTVAQAGVSEATIHHGQRIDWLELNTHGTKLLYRDRAHSLFYYDVNTQSKHTLLHYCNYVQWVPNSDVVVAQSRRVLYVWYSIDHPSEMSMIPIHGDVIQIHRVPGKTEVIVDEGVRKQSIPLDEALIAFGSAIDAHNFTGAVQILETFTNQNNNGNPANGGATSANTAESSNNSSNNLLAMWTQLSRLAMEENNFQVAERCFAALGDLSRASYLHQINSLMIKYHQDAGHFQIQTLLAMMNKNFKRAESLLLSHGCINEAIIMYRSLYKWDEALTIAERRNHPSLQSLRAEYYDYLLSSGQEELAGKVKEKEGDYEAALQLYLKGNYPVRAAELIVSQGMQHNTALCDRVCSALLSAKQYDAAGDFLLNLNQAKRALDAYVKGNNFHRAVELARRHSPGQVVTLEEQWGDHLFQLQQYDAACNHYIQCGQTSKAMECAIEAKQWSKAQSMYEQLDSQTAKPYAKRLAQQCATQGQHNDAERFFIAADCPSEAVQMYTAAGLWEKAHSIAVTYMSEEQVSAIYTQQALKMESAGKLKDAEKLYVTVDEHDLAIAMYKKHRQYEDMIRLIGQYRKESLIDSHLQLARQYETEGNLKLAESHYISGKEWKAAYNMYRGSNGWEDALRVAKTHGGQAAYKTSAYEFAMSVGGDAGMKMLMKRGLGELAVDVAVERQDFPTAFSIAEKTCKTKLPDIHLQYAMALEDEGKFSQAEGEFISAKKPREAIDMYIHQHAWEEAMRVATTYEPTSINDCIEAQAQHFISSKDFKQAEALYLTHKKAESCVKMYLDVSHYEDALRVAKQHAPRLIPQVQQRKTEHTAQTASADTLEYCLSQAKSAINKQQYNQAIEHYLAISAETTHGDLLQLEELWDKAVDLAQKHLTRTRYVEVLQTVSTRLLSLQRYETAAQYYVDGQMYQAAIDSLCQGHLYDKAKVTANTHAPQLLGYITQQQSTHLLTNNNLSTLAAVSPDMAIDAYANSGEWDQVYALATKQGKDMVHKYASLHAAQLVKQHKLHSAVKVFLEYGTPVIPANFPLYKRIATDILIAAGDVERGQPAGSRHSGNEMYMKQSGVVLSDLKTMLSALMKELTLLDPTGSPATRELNQLLLICHFCHLTHVCVNNDIAQSVLNRLCVSLLRYTTVVPVDKHFYDAGLQCRESGVLNMSFVFFNRFVDLTDLMSDPDNSSDIDHSDFLQTDIPSPFNTPLPSIQYYTDAVREEVREWVLDKAMSHDIGQSLSTRPCDKCGKQMYEAALVCHACHYEYECCVVSGYPLQRNKKVSCKTCNKQANKEEWNKYVAKTKACPWCQSTASPVY